MPIDVAIAIVLSGGRILIARRPESAELGGYWEFPGGKCREGELAEQCVVREVREEVSLIVRPIRVLPPIDWHYEHANVRLHPFLCEKCGGKERALWADELRWIAPEELRQYRFPPANAALIEELQRTLSAP